MRQGDLLPSGIPYNPDRPLGTPANPRTSNIAPPPFHRGFSPAHGKKLTSWSDYHQANRDAGLVDTGEKPQRPKNEVLEEGTRGRHVLPGEFPD